MSNRLHREPALDPPEEYTEEEIEKAKANAEAEVASLRILTNHSEAKVLATRADNRILRERVKELENPKPCYWVEEDGDSYWESDCEHYWTFIDGGPVENKVKFCQGCGKPVEVCR